MMEAHRAYHRWLVTPAAVGMLLALVLLWLGPLAVAASLPIQPVNVSPADTTTDISLTHRFQASAFSDPTPGDVHLASQWQVTTASGSYGSPVFDSGVDYGNLISLTMPSGKLSLGTVYYWRVRYQDDKGNWSEWSKETGFKTVATTGTAIPPSVSAVQNLAPANFVEEISLTPALQASAFASGGAGDTHAASQWQITAVSGNYTNPVFDSGVDSSPGTSITVPSGVLVHNTTYYWHVRYQNDKGYWSNWSSQTAFKTIALKSPSAPFNISPVHGGRDVSQSPSLVSSPFVSPDGGATHAASRWQITVTSRQFTGVLLDTGLDTGNLTTLAVPAGLLTYDTTYQWRVRYQDSFGNWSEWSKETGFTTIMLPPATPRHAAPADRATDVSIAVTLTASAFTDLDSGDGHRASQWQVTTVSGNYDSPVYDTGEDFANLESLTLPPGQLNYKTTYYWRVRYQDNARNWSSYSRETAFTTESPPLPPPPAQPSTKSPANRATGVSLAPTLESSSFASPAAGATHSASQWQITTVSASYTTPVFDSGTDTANKTSLVIPAGTLRSTTAYYWRVRHQDSFGNWSEWSAQASFTTGTLPPNTPSNVSPASGATDIGLTPTLTSSPFSDPDEGDSHRISQWQITTVAGDYASPVFDSGSDIINKTSITIPAGKLIYGTTYYWQVRHQDSSRNWSAYSPETRFTTASPPKADFSASPVQTTSGQAVTFTDLSTGVITAWTWDFGDGTTAKWTAKPADGKVTHAYAAAGSYTVRLEITGPAGKDTKTAERLVQVSTATSPAPQPSPTTPVPAPTPTPPSLAG
ncbi:MAG: PKD domain-containing protein, partial [Chloroflexi bacterium]|nr:PKD domain-containing protein [Chloroflexota bacterium]